MWLRSLIPGHGSRICSLFNCLLLQDDRIFIEDLNWPMLRDFKATPAEYKAGLDLAIARGCRKLAELQSFHASIILCTGTSTGRNPQPHDGVLKVTTQVN
jgi:hypothetical protein